MGLGDRKLQEIVRALCVLALIFLNFAHAPFALGGEDAVTAQIGSFCGDPIDSPADAKGNPCQACRIDGGTALPPPPCDIVAAFGPATAPAYAIHEAAAPHGRRFGIASPRDPPAL